MIFLFLMGVECVHNVAHKILVAAFPVLCDGHLRSHFQEYRVWNGAQDTPQEGEVFEPLEAPQAFRKRVSPSWR